MTQRKAIRHACKDLLDAITELEGRVHASRSLPVNGDKPSELPCALIFTDRDPADKADGYTSLRNLALRIVVIVRADAEADDILDDLCEAIEQAIEAEMSGELDADPMLANLVDSCDYVDTILTYAGEEGRAEFVHAEMTYIAKYYRTPAQTFVDLNTAHADIDMSNPRNDPQTDVHPDGQIDASTTINLNP